MSGDDKQDEKLFGEIGTYIGRLLAALGLLSLFDEAEVIKLRGKFETVVAEFSKVTSAVVDFLFGWIDIGWIRLTELEKHVVFFFFPEQFSVECIEMKNGLKTVRGQVSSKVRLASWP